MNFQREQSRTAAFDLTPMIDVVLQLIIFFMYTTQFAQVMRSELDLPQETGEEELDTELGRIVIDIGADGTLLVEQVVVSRGQLITRITDELRIAGGDASKVRLLIRADRNAPTGVVNALARDLSAIGVRGWSLGTERPR